MLSAFVSFSSTRPWRKMEVITSHQQDNHQQYSAWVLPILPDRNARQKAGSREEVIEALTTKIESPSLAGRWVGGGWIRMWLCPIPSLKCFGAGQSALLLRIPNKVQARTGMVWFGDNLHSLLPRFPQESR